MKSSVPCSGQINTSEKMSVDSIQAPPLQVALKLSLVEVLSSKLDRFLSTIDVIWETIPALIKFPLLWYFNAKVRYYCSLDIFYTVQEIGMGCA